MFVFILKPELGIYSFNSLLKAAGAGCFPASKTLSHPSPLRTSHPFKAFMNHLSINSTCIFKAKYRL